MRALPMPRALSGSTGSGAVGDDPCRDAPRGADALGVPRPALLRRLARRGARTCARRRARGGDRCRQIVRDGAVLRLPTHQPRLTRDDEKLWQRLEPLLAVDDLRPPRVRELAEALGLEPEATARLMKRFERFGRVASVAANRYFLPGRSRALPMSRVNSPRLTPPAALPPLVQGPLGRRPQFDDRNPRISRPGRCHSPKTAT
jgi:hypothetical protein